MCSRREGEDSGSKLPHSTWCEVNGDVAPSMCAGHDISCPYEEKGKGANRDLPASRQAGIGGPRDYSRGLT